jgi:hypothetical protein
LLPSPSSPSLVGSSGLRASESHVAVVDPCWCTVFCVQGFDLQLFDEGCGSVDDGCGVDAPVLQLAGGFEQSPARAPLRLAKTDCEYWSRVLGSDGDDELVPLTPVIERVAAALLPPVAAPSVTSGASAAAALPALTLLLAKCTCGCWSVHPSGDVNGTTSDVIGVLGPSARQLTPRALSCMADGAGFSQLPPLRAATAAGVSEGADAWTLLLNVCGGVQVPLGENQTLESLQSALSASIDTLVVHLR